MPPWVRNFQGVAESLARAPILVSWKIIGSLDLILLEFRLVSCHVMLIPRPVSSLIDQVTQSWNVDPVRNMFTLLMSTLFSLWCSLPLLSRTNGFGITLQGLSSMSSRPTTYALSSALLTRRLILLLLHVWALILFGENCGNSEIRLESHTSYGDVVLTPFPLRIIFTSGVFWSIMFVAYISFSKTLILLLPLYSASLGERESLVAS